VAVVVAVASGVAAPVELGVGAGVSVLVAVPVAVAVAVRVAVAVNGVTGVLVALAVAVAAGVRVAVLVGLETELSTMTVMLLALAASPKLVPLPLTAFPQALRATVTFELGAVQRKENVTTPPAAGLRLVWVISALPAAVLVWVNAELLPPVLRVPLADETFRPPWFCAPVWKIARLYSFTEPPATVVGPDNVTSGTIPPEWHWLQPLTPKLAVVIPLEKPRATAGKQAR
jgi:hypothetical protein